MRFSFSIFFLSIIIINIPIIIIIFFHIFSLLTFFLGLLFKSLKSSVEPEEEKLCELLKAGGTEEEGEREEGGMGEEEGGIGELEEEGGG